MFQLAICALVGRGAVSHPCPKDRKRGRDGTLDQSRFRVKRFERSHKEEP